MVLPLKIRGWRGFHYPWKLGWWCIIILYFWGWWTWWWLVGGEKLAGGVSSLVGVIIGADGLCWWVMANSWSGGGSKFWWRQGLGSSAFGDNFLVTLLAVMRSPDYLAGSRSVRDCNRWLTVAGYLRSREADDVCFLETFDYLDLWFYTCLWEQHVQYLADKLLLDICWGYVVGCLRHPWRWGGNAIGRLKYVMDGSWLGGGVFGQTAACSRW